MRNFMIVFGLICLSSCSIGTSQKDSKSDSTAVFNADTFNGTHVDSVKIDSVNVK
jgi:hypothetical protein